LIKAELAGNLISITFISDSEYELKIPFAGNSVSLITYADNSYSNTAVAEGDFVKRYKSTSIVAFQLEIRN
jgi:hypothetical protein